MEQNIRLTMIGRLEGLRPPTSRRVRADRGRDLRNTGATCLAVNYGERSRSPTHETASPEDVARRGGGAGEVDEAVFALLSLDGGHAHLT